MLLLLIQNTCPNATNSSQPRDVEINIPWMHIDGLILIRNQYPQGDGQLRLRGHNLYFK